MTVVWEPSTDSDFQDYTVLHSATEDGDQETLATYTDIATTSHSLTEFDPTIENWFYVQVTDTLGLTRMGTGMTSYVYDSEEADAEIANLSADFVAYPVMATCNPYVDKVDEYVNIGCGDNPGCIA